MNNRDDQLRKDEEFSKRLAATLDDSVDALDADTRARLAAVRRAALTRNRSRRIAAGLALAASVTALLLVPRLWTQTDARQTESALQRQELAAMNGGEDIAYLSVDPQLLDDMDMLQAMDELQSEDRVPAIDSSRGES